MGLCHSAPGRSEIESRAGRCLVFLQPTALQVGFDVLPQERRHHLPCFILDGRRGVRDRSVKELVQGGVCTHGERK